MLLRARNFHLRTIRTFYRPAYDNLVSKFSENTVDQKYSDALSKFESKILFNSVLELQKVKFRRLDYFTEKKECRLEERVRREVKPLPLILNQLCAKPVTQAVKPPEEEEKIVATDLPHSRVLKVEVENQSETDEQQHSNVPKNWLQDYELYNESESEIESTYGTPNPNTPVSDVPCGGCGAFLHCKETSIPGYIPSQLFVGLKHTELKTIRCQRCHFLENYNTAINVTVGPEDYINIISTIKDKFALAVVLVDLLDFPCSIFSGLRELLGPNRPIVIVGNKVDLLPKDHPNSLNHIKSCLRSEATRMGFDEKYIRHVSLISAKTGYGVEELITQLHNIWKYKGDVYLIGCTNVGKSSLFNALLRSDYCKVQARDLVQRATTCPWPGTTLRMLKFPILRPSDYRLFLRTKRLVTERGQKFEEEKLRRAQANSTKDPKYATLIGHIGRTFDLEKPEHSDPASSSHDGGFSGQILTLNEKNENYIESKWCFDTPGVIQQDQILHLLTTDEIIKTVPKEMMRARAFLMSPNLSLFLAGLGRIDYIEGPEKIRMIIFSSMELPVSIVPTEEAEEFYDTFLGSEILGVPMDSGKDRLKMWPKLEAKHTEIVVEGIQKHITACDIMMSSAGWVGINLPSGFTGKFKAWTPEQRGAYVRSPSLLPYGMNLRGRRVRRSLAYRIGDAFTYQKIKK